MKSIALIIPTFNRANRIGDTLESIKRAQKPLDFKFKVYLINNNSNSQHSKAYKALVELYLNQFEIIYLFEEKQGRSNALNRGIMESHESLIGFIDDDERIDSEWMNAIAYNFGNPDIEYIGGPCLPDWEETPPCWLPAHSGLYRGLLGWIEQAPVRKSYEDFSGELCGGNCVLRRGSLLQVGFFNVKLGRKANDLAGGEDGELHRRLKAAGKHGVYDPNLIIYHKIPVSRMSFRYHLRWAFWSGVSNGVRIRSNPEIRENCPHLLGIPRYWFQKAAIGMISVVSQAIHLNWKNNPNGICGAMDIFYLIGLFFGRYLKQSD